MAMSLKEISVIKAAIQSRNRGKLLQPFLCIILIAALFTMILGAMSGEQFAYLAIPLIFLTLIQPQLGGAPKYSELVDILERQLPQKETMEDVLSQEIRKHNKQTN